MSLILDALRKSEAERRKAQAARDALAETPRAPASSLTRVPAWAWPATALAALVLVAWLLLTRTPAADANRAPGPISADMQAMDEAAARPTASPLPEGTDPANTLPITPAASSITATTAMPIASPALAAPPAQTRPPAPTATAPTGAPVAAAAAMTGTARTPLPPPTASTMPETSASTSRAQQRPPVPAATATAATATAATLPAAGATDSGNAVAATPPAPSRAVPGNAPLRLSDLGTADRQLLPPLKMSMHMWGPDATKRFAIIDGNRVSEGDRVGSAVVEAIDQHGVVLAWNGYRLRVPVR